jgi:hypothetical protein
MTPSAAHPRPAVASRRVSYAVSAVVNTALLCAVNVWPGWQAVPFLTAETPQVLPLVNAAILVGVAANLVYVLYDPRWLRSLGDVVTTAVGLVALVGIWRVFPMDFGAASFDWGLVARVVLAVAIVGSVIAILVAVATLVRSLAVRPA